MTSEVWLNTATRQLNDSGITTARLDCLVLLEDILQMDRARVLAHPETELTEQVEVTLAAQLARRMTHEPLAYIRGHAEFYGRDFVVDSSVLVPRPESETIISMLTSLPPTTLRTVADIGTGSGALAITAKLELPTADVVGIDIDAQCLRIAEKNAGRLTADVSFLKGNLLEPLIAITRSAPAAAPSLLLCNIPYVPDAYAINQAARHEPELALFAGSDGLDLYRELFLQLEAAEWEVLPCILAESLPEQHAALATMAAGYNYRIQTTTDFIQLFVPQG